MGKGRRPCCDKAGVKKGPWSQAEDFKLISFIQNHGHNNWRALPKLAGLARCGKSCRLRWVNYLRPDLKRGEFTPQEEETIIKLHEELGNKWSKIASHFPGRTDNEIKNVWNTHLKKRLKDKGCHEKSTKSSCNTLSTSPSTSNEALEESMNLDCHANVPNKHQTITNNNNNDNIEYSSSSSSSYNSQPSSLDHKITDDLNPNPNPLENIGDHKDAASSCTDKKSENLLDELIEIPFEPNLDLWDLLQGDSEVQVKDIDTPMFENDTMKNENTLMQDGGSWWWLVYLENELGLESTLPQSTKATSTLDFFSDISI